MSTIVPTTAEQLAPIAATARSRGERCELVGGEVRFMSPAGWQHGEVAALLHIRIGHHIVENRLGKALTAETGFVVSRDPDTVRAPDFAFVAKAHLPPEGPSEPYWPGVPDFAIEVLSPSDTTGEVDGKISMWINAGVKQLWVVDPQLQTVTSNRSMTDVTVHVGDDVLEAPDLLPGLRFTVASVFS